MAAIASQNFVDAGAAAAETRTNREAAVTATLPHGPPVPLPAAAVYHDDQRHLQESDPSDRHPHHHQQQSPQKVS